MGIGKVKKREVSAGIIFLPARYAVIYVGTTTIRIADKNPITFQVKGRKGRPLCPLRMYGGKKRRAITNSDLNTSTLRQRVPPDGSQKTLEISTIPIRHGLSFSLEGKALCSTTSKNRCRQKPLKGPILESAFRRRRHVNCYHCTVEFAHEQNKDALYHMRQVVSVGKC